MSGLGDVAVGLAKELNCVARDCHEVVMRHELLFLLHDEGLFIAPWSFLGLRESPDALSGGVGSEGFLIDHGYFYFLDVDLPFVLSRILGFNELRECGLKVDRDLIKVCCALSAHKN